MPGLISYVSILEKLLLNLTEEEECQRDELMLQITEAINEQVNALSFDETMMRYCQLRDGPATYEIVELNKIELTFLQNKMYSVYVDAVSIE